MGLKCVFFNSLLENDLPVSVTFHFVTDVAKNAEADNQSSGTFIIR